MLEDLKKTKNVKKKRRVGRGYASSKGGHTIGKGQKGQKSRSGYSAPRPGFEGGQMPLSRRIPKLRGFGRLYFKDKNPKFTLTLDSLVELVDETKKKELKEFENMQELKETLGINSSHQNYKVKVVAGKKYNDKKSAGEIKKTVQDKIVLLLESGLNASKSVKSFFK